jgi:aspartyl-tRNA(Asn)/glutamyl-tRNA(Gln) amidotransferase subunit A
MTTLDELARQLNTGALTARALVDAALDAIADPAGEVTSAGSRLLSDQPPALRDAPVVARLRAAGFIFIGRNTMTEFAYSGLGLNPHYGTPLSPFERATRRIPGGSTGERLFAIAQAIEAHL